MAKAWIGESLLQPPVAGEQEQAFAVGIQPACGIDPWQLDQISQAAPASAWFWRELTQASIGLVQQQNIVLVLLVFCVFCILILSMIEAGSSTECGV